MLPKVAGNKTAGWNACCSVRHSSETYRKSRFFVNEMAKILLLETATEICSTGISIDGTLVALAEETEQPKHAERLTLLIQDCTRQAGLTLADLDAVAISGGPGSYTALRVGTSVAKGICYALDKPLIAVDTLLALADASLTNLPPGNATPVLAMPMLDARRREVWTAVFNAGRRAVVPAQPLVLEHDLFEKFMQDVPQFTPGTRLVVSGNGAIKLESVPIPEGVVFSPVRTCSVRHFQDLAERFFQQSDFQNITYYEPFYMKSPNITTPNKPLF
ncbi:MAG: tRNA (adenosine(37)-N6)-threonylcarbamoyltransferase complex dimerization subunit type 1 TsaB [Bacteroidetes bacterium]|nr:MAG: tRNA (adenosine(37)-N6)-threonylcarbamoyltransferase complex dimerization subunit type 1 TsaB [Bacteroidota bacterium]